MYALMPLRAYFTILCLVPSQYSFDGYNLYNSRLKREFVSIISTLTGY